MCVCVCVCATLHPTLHDPMDCSLLDSLVHWILQARILEWVAISFPRASSPPRDQTCISCIDGQALYRWHHLGSPMVGVRSTCKAMVFMFPQDSSNRIKSSKEAVSQCNYYPDFLMSYVSFALFTPLVLFLMGAYPPFKNAIK